ncbi:DUF4044 domain-containing protein [Clostridium neonatale]|nr:DUF4044 domain-containing protein [Clostridium neonatale]MBP8311701.1 DUF4044 domain-containing protein [Clostridium neonatale]
MKKKTREKLIVAITIFIILIFVIGFIPTILLF